MGITTAIIYGVTSAVAGAAANKLTAPKIKTPGAPPAVPALPAPVPVETAKATTAAGTQQKKKASGAVGRSDTILTSPSGLGAIQQQNLQGKTLLGL